MLLTRSLRALPSRRLAVTSQNSKRLKSDVPGKKDEESPKHAAPPSLQVPQELLTKYKGKYQVGQKQERVKYDYSPPPKPSEVSTGSTRNVWTRKVLPGAIIVAGALWLMYTYKYVQKEEGEDAILHPTKFTKWIITYKYDLPECPDHFILELTKRNFQKLKPQFKVWNSQWNGHRLWSVEICQPDINIVRSYTPLPLYVGSIDRETNEPFLKIIEHPDEEGKFLLYVKKYDQGEMGRWLYNRPLFSELLVRGPYEDYRLPFSPVNDLPDREVLKNVPSKVAAEKKIPGNVKPDNLVFYVAGTGITPLLQMLYSQNPPKGFVEVYWSLNSDKEILKNFADLNFMLEKLGRAKFHYLVANKKQFLQPNDIKSPEEKQYKGYKSLDFMVDKEIALKVETISQKQSLSQLEKDSLVKQLSEDANDKLFQPHQYKNQLEQYNAIKDKLVVKNAAIAIICGPDGYLNYVCGAKNLNNAQNIDTAPITGLLGAKGWDKTNTVRM